MAINTRRDRLPFETRIVTEQLFPASQLLTSIITFGPQPNKAIVGENAFAHEAGIHQDGYLKERTTYEIIDPTSVGVPESRWCWASTADGTRWPSALRRPGLRADARSSSIASTSVSPRWPTARRACATTRSRDSSAR